MRFKDWFTEQDIGPGSSEFEQDVQKTTRDAIEKLGTPQEVNPKDAIKATFKAKIGNMTPGEAGNAMRVLSKIVGPTNDDEDAMNSKKKSKKNSKKKSKKKQWFEQQKFAQDGTAKKSGGTKLGPKGMSGRAGESPAKPGKLQKRMPDPNGPRPDGKIPQSDMSPGATIPSGPTPPSIMSPGTKHISYPDPSVMSLGTTMPSPRPSPFASVEKYTKPTNFDWPKKA